MGPQDEDSLAPRRSTDVTRSITIVSGMPRSGTSMMMQMLEAAGLTVVTDRRRVPDDDNPNGYFELDAVKRLRTDASFLAEAIGKVVKVVAPLLPSLPPRFDYRIVFMERDLDEVLSSQREMLERSGEAATRVDDPALKRAYARELDRVKLWLAEQPNVEATFVSHRLAFEAPAQTAETVAEFLFQASREEGASEGPDLLGARVESMARVVDASLRRHGRRQSSNRMP